MTASLPSLIELAYSPDLFHEAGRRLVDHLTEHLRRVSSGQGPVFPWKDPRENLGAARATLVRPGGPVPVGTVSDAADRFTDLVRESLSRGHNLHHPHYIGHQVPAPVPLAGLFDGLGAITNNPMAIYEMGPWSTSAEQAMIGELGAYLGWFGTAATDTNAVAVPSDIKVISRDAGGIVTHGASLANLTALLVARNRALGGCWEEGVAASSSGPAPVIFTQADAHYCITRAGGILGLGTKQVIKVPLDSRRRMDVGQLDSLLKQYREKGHPIIAVAASACATPIGAFDPLDQIADVCLRHDVWLHVDAAHGGAALLSAKHRSLVAGIGEADSVTWDAHKMLFVPALCAFLFYKRKSDSYEAFRQSAPYLFDPRSPELMDFDGGLRTVECTKRAMVLGLWSVWSMFGPQLFSELVDHTFALARLLHDKLAAADDFEPLHEPQCNIVVFRHIPERLRSAPPAVISALQDRLRRVLCQSGQFYIVPCSIDGVSALRCTVMNPLTAGSDFDELLDALRALAKAENS